MLRLLGPVRVGGTPDAALDSPRQRLVLAALAVDANRQVPVEVLVDRIWGTKPPPSARRTLHAYIARVRRLLSGMDGVPATVDGHSGAYLLQLDPGRVDLHRFRQLQTQAREADCPPARRAELLRDAIGLWHGQPLSGLAGDWAARMRESWEQERTTAMIRWADAEIEAGEPAVALGSLADLAAEHPLNESLAAALMRTLARVGQTAEALRRYEDARARLADELGIDPGPELRAAHQALLRGELAPPGATSTVAPAPDATSTAPAQLPRGVPAFAGRQPEMARLSGLLAATGTAAGLAVVSGPPGVGKTSLAVRWAHQVAGQFPDGQLYVDMRGFDPDHPPADRAGMVRRFLAALGSRTAELPADLDALSAQFRSTMAGRRVLLVLDNAASAEQVRPLLPGAAGCAVVVTSRNELTSLVATDDAVPVRLDPLTEQEARHLLELRLGTERIVREPAAVSEIISRCGRLPIALAVAAAHARARPGTPLAVEAEQLGSAGGGLDAFDGGDPRSNLRAVFSWSYRALDDAAARLFCLLALHPGPDAAAAAVASIAGITLAAARPHLTSLVRANLLTETTPGRYALHDLLRAYGTELAAALDTGRRRAEQRLMEHYARTATAAVLLLDPARPGLPADSPPPDVTVVPPTNQPSALAWFAAEDANLQAAIAAARDGTDRQAWQLASAMTTYLDWIGHWHDLVKTQLAILPALDRLRDLPAAANAQRDIGRTYAQLGRYAEAATHLGVAMESYRALADPVGQGRCLHSLGWMHQAQGDYGAALAHSEQALGLFRAAGNLLWQARELDATGWLHLQLGEPEAALDRCRRALPLLRDLGDRHGEAGTLDTLGLAHHRRGDDEEAIGCLDRALRIYTELGDRYSQASVGLNLGDCHAARGRAATASRCWRAALDSLRTLDQAGTESLRTQLTDRCRSAELIE